MLLPDITTHTVPARATYQLAPAALSQNSNFLPSILTPHLDSPFNLTRLYLHIRPPPRVQSTFHIQIRIPPLKLSTSADAAPGKFRRIESRQIAGSGKWISPAAAPPTQTIPLRHPALSIITKPGAKEITLTIYNPSTPALPSALRLSVGLPATTHHHLPHHRTRDLHNKVLRGRPPQPSLDGAIATAVLVLPVLYCIHSHTRHDTHETTRITLPHTRWLALATTSETGVHTQSRTRRSA